MQDPLVMNEGRVLHVDEEELFKQIDRQLGVDLIALRIDPAHFSYDDYHYSEVYGEGRGLPLLFDHNSPIEKWGQFRWIYTDTGSATDENTRYSHRIGVRFVYTNFAYEDDAPFTGFAWLVIQQEDGQPSLSIERVVFALDSRYRSREACQPRNKESRLLRDLINLSKLPQQLADGIQEKLIPLNGRHNTNDTMLFSFALPEFSFAKLEEGAELDTLSPLDVHSLVQELEQEGVQVPNPGMARHTARIASDHPRIDSDHLLGQYTSEAESESESEGEYREPEPVRLVRVGQLPTIPLSG